MRKNGASQRPSHGAREHLRKLYDQLWSDAIGRIRAGTVELDPVLGTREADQRRGLTVIARPPARVRRRVVAFLRELRQLEPDQYYYMDSELHVTILSLFTATVRFEPFFANRERYVAAVDAALKKVGPIRIEFEGITASPGTVMIQGFFETDSLEQLRYRLRRQLQLRNLEEGVDRRYKLETAHMTVTRFRAALRASEQFAVALQRARNRPFGATTIRSFSLVENDWYMSHRATNAVRRYLTR